MFYYTKTDENGVLCVDALDVCNRTSDWTEEEVARLAVTYPDTVYFEVGFKPARWMNTGGDMLIHLVPLDTVTDGYPHAYQETSPKCGLGIYHGGWHSITEVKVPLRLCDRCFPGGRL